MIYVGIDVAKDKHDCIIKNSVGEVVCKTFTIKNNLDGFNKQIILTYIIANPLKYATF